MFLIYPTWCRQVATTYENGSHVARLFSELWSSQTLFIAEYLSWFWEYQINASSAVSRRQQDFLSELQPALSSCSLAKRLEPVHPQLLHCFPSIPRVVSEGLANLLLFAQMWKVFNFIQHSIVSWDGVLNSLLPLDANWHHATKCNLMYEHCELNLIDG